LDEIWKIGTKFEKELITLEVLASFCLIACAIYLEAKRHHYQPVC
jgi:hypothetical protein